MSVDHLLCLQQDAWRDVQAETTLTDELGALDRLETVATLADALVKGELAGYAKDVLDLLHQHTPQARQMLKKLLAP